MKKLNAIGLALCLASSATAMGCMDCQGTASQNPELPISRVVMYQSGIGYVERTDTISGDELILRIRPDQINDILKSLTVIDRGSGRPVSISLPVDKRTLDRLAQIPHQIREGGIRALLDAFRGAHVKIKSKRGSFNGRLVGIDEGSDQPELSINSDNSDGSTVTLKTDHDVLEIIPIKEIKSVELYDKALSNGLDKSLNISLNAGDWKQVELRIRMDSNKTRELALSYIVSMPTWNPAYRLILNDNNTGTLQGWAIVSNVTGSDWNNISFSLVSGQPMSFTYDLYTPHFLQRPNLSYIAPTVASAPVITASGAAAQAAAAPMMDAMDEAVEAEEVIAWTDDDFDYPMPKARKTAAAKNARSGGFGSGGFGPSAKRQNNGIAQNNMEDDWGLRDYAETKSISSNEMIANFNQLANNAQIGTFDEYKLASRLTVPDGNTALVNLLQKDVSALDTRMFDKSKTPYNFGAFFKGWKKTKSYQTIQLKNDGDVALDNGPITIYRDGAVIGEGYLSRTEKGDTAFITFANENRVTVEVADSKSESKYKLDSFDNAKCNYTQITSVTNDFFFESRMLSPTYALFQLPIASNWEPVDFPDSVITNGESRVISVKFEGSGNEKVTVPLTMKTESKSYGVSFQDTSCIKAIHNAIDNNDMDEENAAKFSEFLNNLEEMNDIIVELKSINSQISDIRSDQFYLSNTLSDLKQMKSNDAEKLRKQLIQRQTDNEKKLAELTEAQLLRKVRQGELDLILKQAKTDLHYTRK